MVERKGNRCSASEAMGEKENKLRREGEEKKKIKRRGIDKTVETVRLGRESAIVGQFQKQEVSGKYLCRVHMYVGTYV